MHGMTDREREARDEAKQEFYPRPFSARPDVVDVARWDAFDLGWEAGVAFARSEAEERLAELDGELGRVGLDSASVATLIRHHRNNEAAAVGARFHVERSEAETREQELLKALAMIEAMGRDALQTPQELALTARSALRVPDPAATSEDLDA